MTLDASATLISQLPEVRAITLDLDNTLWDMIEVLHRAEANSYELLKREFPRIPQKYELEDILAVRQSLFDELPHIRHDLTQLRIEVFAELLRSVNYEESHAQYLMEKFSIDRNRVDLFPDVIPALEHLCAAYPLIALSDGNSDLAVIGIRRYFTDCVFAAQVGHMKPHPAGFLKACEAAGTNPSETIHIGITRNTTSKVQRTPACRRCGFVETKSSGHCHLSRNIRLKPY